METKVQRQVIACNVLQLGEVADFERQRFDLAQMFIRNPKLDLSTETSILPNCCYLLVRFNSTELEFKRKRFFFSFFCVEENNKIINKI